jgi:hypothetical protein
VPLTDRERAVLDLERSWWTEDGVKEVLVHERLGLSSTRYYALLNELLERDEALAYDPLVVRRLRRLRERRRKARLDAAHAARPGADP